MSAPQPDPATAGEGPEAEPEAPPGPAMPGPLVRWVLLIFGCVCVALGATGVFVPLLPTTPFLLVALWCFSRSSQRFRRWLYTHPRFGPSLRDWHEHRVIPIRAKLVAVAVMAASLLYVTLFVADTWVLPAVVAAVLLPPALFVTTRRSRVPSEPGTSGAQSPR